MSMASSEFAADAIRRVIGEMFAPTCFVVRPPLSLEWRHSAEEELFWELFRGHVLDRDKTRQRQTFETWSVCDRTEPEAGNEPIVAVRWQHDAKIIYVTRGVLCRSWEAFADELGAIQSRPVVKRVRELIGAIDLMALHGIKDLQTELSVLLLQAIVGTSRLPLTSWESPLPEFQTGHLHYVGLPSQQSDAHRTRTLEFHLRSGDLPNDMEEREQRWQTHRFGLDNALHGFERVLNDASLSPVTGWFGRLWETIELLERERSVTAADVVDFVTRQLRLLFRHLNAFDLVRFHHRGANYPDAILLEQLLRLVLRRAVDSPAIFLTSKNDDHQEATKKRNRRFGLLAGWLLVDRYRGLAVPDRPTSPGENIRVIRFAEMGDPLADDQILDPARRTHRLFQDDWPQSFDCGEVLCNAVDDLAKVDTVCELGIALFLDRPFGFFKQRGEPDKTPLLSYVAFSRAVAEQHLQIAQNSEGLSQFGQLLREAASRLSRLSELGVSRPNLPRQRGPEAACLEDAAIAAEDFRFCALTKTSRLLLARHFDLTPLREHAGIDLENERGLLFRSLEDVRQLLYYDRDWRLRVILIWDPEAGFIHRRGVELPAGGLQLMCVDGVDVSRSNIRLLPRR